MTPSTIPFSKRRLARHGGEKSTTGTLVIKGGPFCIQYEHCTLRQYCVFLQICDQITAVNQIFSNSIQILLVDYLVPMLRSIILTAIPQLISPTMSFLQPITPFMY